MGGGGPVESSPASPVAVPEPWVLIEDKYYNISEFSKKHPGGSHVLMELVHQDATDAFINFHDRSILSKYEYLVMPKPQNDLKRPQGDPVKTDALLKDYREWHKRLHEQGLFQPKYAFFARQLALTVVILFVALVPVWRAGFFWLSAILAGVANVQLGWLMHDLGHRSVTTTRAGDRKLNEIVMQLLLGGSAGWWTSKHNRHHLYPNVQNVDPDIKTDPLFVWDKTKQKGGAWNKFQAYYFPFLGPPLGVLFMNFLVFRYAWKHKEYFTLLWIATYCTLWFTTYGFLHFFTMRVVQGAWFLWVVASNHFSEEVLDRSTAERMDWVHLVGETTANVSGGWFLDWFTGHLNYQVEHHLFPRMPRCNYPLVAKEAEALFRKHNLRYRSYTPWQVTKRIFATLSAQHHPQ